MQRLLRIILPTFFGVYVKSRVSKVSDLDTYLRLSSKKIQMTLLR